MAGRGDLAGFFKGLALIRQALVETSGKDLKHAWENSSVKTAAKQAGLKLQENLANAQAPNVSEITVSTGIFTQCKFLRLIKVALLLHGFLCSHKF